jgi:hypothetical protein
MDIQRYVSRDLTHFVGRGRKPLNQQYQVLRKILTERVLRAPKPKRFSRAPYVLRIYRFGLSENRAYRGSVVCFCDIPQGDLGLHMRKYGRFGLAFAKDFLLERGATPVRYIPDRGRPDILPWPGYARGRVSSNARAYDEFWERFRRLRQLARDESTNPQLSKLVREVSAFLDIHVLSHLKFFNPFAREWHAENFYMEREWRVSRDVRFALREVRRVILPESYARDFRRDFPRYDGELLFAD